MPKLKTNRAARKRFRRTKNGKFKRSRAYGAHLLTHKSAKRRRNLRKQVVLDSTDEKNVRGLLPYS